MTSLVKQIDRGLKRYYDHKGVNYLDDEGIGKFALWSEENGYDSDVIKEELDTGKPNDSTMVEFDDEFPTDKTGDTERALDIFKKLRYCAKDPSAFFNNADLPGQYTGFLDQEQAQIQMATKVSLQEYHEKAAVEPRISGTDTIEPYKPGMPKFHQYNNNQYKEPQYPSHPQFETDEEREIYGHDDDDYYRQSTQNKAFSHREPKSHGSKAANSTHTKSKTTTIPREWIASDPVYESQVYALDLDDESIKDSALQQIYRNARDLRAKADKARLTEKYKGALKYYSQIFLHLGCNGTRKLSDFVNDRGDDNPLNAPSKLDIALDKLRMTALLRMAEIYDIQARWQRVVDKCNQVLEDKEAQQNNIKALVLRGKAYRKLRKFESAKKDLESAKKSKVVSLEIEQEMSSLSRNMQNKFSDDEDEEEEMGIGGIGGIGGFNDQAEPTSISTFKNDNYPQLPVRDEVLEQWIKDKRDQHTYFLEVGVLYPNPQKKPSYQFYTRQEVLDVAVIWLDIDVVRKVVSMSKFDLNRSTICKGAAYLNQLASGQLLSGFKYQYNRDKFNTLLTFLCENDANLEERDEQECTALANTVKYGWQELGTILLKFGANVNDGTVQRECEAKSDTKWVRTSLNIMREHTMKAIQEVVAMQYGVQNAQIEELILNYILST